MDTKKTKTVTWETPTLTVHNQSTIQGGSNAVGAEFVGGTLGTSYTP